MKGLAAFQADTFYHVINHAVRTENLFREAENFRFFLEKFSHYMQPVCDIYAYCLMPNHFHFLLRIHTIDTLKALPKYEEINTHKFVMQRLSNFLNSYAKAYNKCYERKGALFIDYTKRFVVNTDAYFKRVVHYIHKNPIKHGFVSDIQTWRYSSYHAFLSEREAKLQRTFVLDCFDGRAAFLEYHEGKDTGLDDEVEFM